MQARCRALYLAQANCSLSAVVSHHILAFSTDNLWAPVALNIWDLHIEFTSWARPHTTAYQKAGREDPQTPEFNP